MKHVLFALLIVTSACGKKSDAKQSMQDRAKALAAKYGPKLGELSKHLPDVAAKAKDLPVNIPGADKLPGLLADNKDKVEEAQKLLASLPEKLGKESPEQAEKDIAEAEKIIAADVAKAEADEKEEAAILSKK